MVNIEMALSWVLRSGVLLAAALMSLGFFLNQDLLWAGVVVLAITPLLRVAMSGLLFLYNGEKFFFIIALYVIVILVISVLII
jgi:uncharacterized membrane protein